jgi:hypothetical protein
MSDKKMNEISTSILTNDFKRLFNLTLTFFKFSFAAAFSGEKEVENFKV